jgi:hypothetical protein
VKGFPQLEGDDVEESYNNGVLTASIATIMYATFPFSVVSGAPFILGAFIFGMAGNVSKYRGDVNVYDRVEKMGVTTELITGKNSEALVEYLQSKNLTVPEGPGSLLDSYTGGNYSFVITYISDIEQFKNESQKEPYWGIDNNKNLIETFVRFPAGRIYYPLRPTGVYKSRTIPVLLYITGFVTPQMYDSIKDGTGVNYYTIPSYRTNSDGVTSFLNGKKEVQNFQYTKIKISVPSDRFTEDLWIDPQPPGYLQNRIFLTPYLFPLYVCAYIIFSMLSCLIAGFFWFRKKPVPKKDLLVHGLWNCLTFIGFTFQTKKRFPIAEYGPRVRFILLYYSVFGVLFSILTLALRPDLLYGICLSWVVAALFPVVSILGGFMMVLMMYFNPVSFIFLLWGFIPALLLLKIRRWIDPVPTENLPIKKTHSVPPTPQPETDQPYPPDAVTSPEKVKHKVPRKKKKISLKLRFPPMNGFEKRWGSLALLSMVIFIVGFGIYNFTGQTGSGEIIGRIGGIGLFLALLGYCTCLFDTRIVTYRIIAAALFSLPFLISSLTTNNSAPLLYTGISDVIIFIIVWVLLYVAARVRKILLTRLLHKIGPEQEYPVSIIFFVLMLCGAVLLSNPSLALIGV